MKFLLAPTTLLTVGVLLTAAEVPSGVTYLTHDQVSTTMAKGEGHLPIFEKQGLKVFTRRRGAGEVELHEKTAHVFIIVDGEATLVIGGTLVNARQTAPDQQRAASVQGGQTYHLTKGDVITVPAKTPHWWKEVSTQTIVFYGMDIESQ